MNYKVNEIKVRYTETRTALQSGPIKSSQEAAHMLFQLWDEDTIALQERFKVLYLNNANRVKGVFQLSQGGINGTLVDMRILFGIALKSMSVALILAHNHPSGNTTPSEADKRLTKKIQQAAEFFDIKVLDHLILTPNGDYFSFADQHMI